MFTPAFMKISSLFFALWQKMLLCSLQKLRCALQLPEKNRADGGLHDGYCDGVDGFAI